MIETDVKQEWTVGRLLDGERSGVVSKFVPTLICVSSQRRKLRCFKTGVLSSKTCRRFNATDCYSAGIRVSRSIWDSFLWSDSKVLAVTNISTREQNLTRHRSALHRVNVLSCFTSFPPLSAIQPPSFSFTVPLVAPPLPGGWWPGKSMPLPALVALPLCRSSSLILAGKNPNRSTK